MKILTVPVILNLFNFLSLKATDPPYDVICVQMSLKGSIGSNLLPIVSDFELTGKGQLFGPLVGPEANVENLCGVLYYMTRSRCAAMTYSLK